jgi:membrane fusion protein, multidrug efflux system
MDPYRFMRSLSGPALVTLLSAGLTSAACSKSESAQAKAGDTSKPVSVEAVREEQVHRAVEVVGTLAAQEEVTVSSQAEGAVSRIVVDLGDHVRAGETLVELDREKAQYRYDQQRAAYERALAKYGVTTPGRLPPIEETPDVQKAAAELAQAQQSFQRAEELHKRQLIPRQQLDDADATLRAKKAEYESALHSARNLSSDIDAAAAAMKLADREVRDTVIRAPFDGNVQKRLVSLGEYVKAQTPVMSIVRIDPLKVTAEIPERMAPWVQLGQAIELRVDAFPGKTLVGKVTRISPSVSTQSRSFGFEALVPNPDAALKPGTFAHVRLETARVDRVLTLPYAALQYRYGVNRAFVVNGDHLAARELKVGDRIGDRIEVLAGVTASDQVALTDVDRLSDGVKVRIAKPVE